jgi:segregation and condensation protein A
VTLADYRVNLEIFAGPLDLLLHLVRKEEVDLYDIPIATITDQYIRYIEILKSLDIDIAGDFLVMAATLMEIKSVMLLPKAEPDQLDQDDFVDPRAELIRQLLEYKRYKDAANLLDAAADRHKERFGRPDVLLGQLSPDSKDEIDIEQVSVWDLLEAFDTICRATGTAAEIRHIKDDTPIDLYQIEILHRLQEEGPMTFERIFESKPDRAVMIGLFLALLELIREKLVWVEQATPSQIYLRSLTTEPAEQAVQKVVLAASAVDVESLSQTVTQEQRLKPIGEPSRQGQQTIQPVPEEPQKAPISIVELSPDKKLSALHPKQEIRQVESNNKGDNY